LPITFTVKREYGYFISKYVGRVTDEDLIEPWKAFLEGDEWVPGLNELTDISEMDGQGLTIQGLERLSEYVSSFLSENYDASIKVAIYSPGDLPFGLARTYEAISDESPETVSVFRDREKAESWIIEK
jgi:hypothetical protein